MDPKNTDEAPSSSSFPHAHEGAPDHPSSSSSSLPAADSTLRPTSPPPSSSSSALPADSTLTRTASPLPTSSSSTLPADSTLTGTSPPPSSSSSHPLIPSILYCNFCEEEFDDFEVLFEHITCEHPGQLGEDRPPSPSPSPSPSIHLQLGDGPLFNCYDCEEVFRDFQAWLDHSENSHPFEPSRHFLVPESPEVRAVRLIRCTLCRKTFLPQEEMCQHVRNARATASICHLCGQTFANSDESRIHVWDAHRPIVAICAVVLARRVAGGHHRRSSPSARPREAAAPPRPSFAAAAAGHGLVRAALQGQAEAAGPRFNCRSCSGSFATRMGLAYHSWAAHRPIIAIRERAAAPQPPAGSGAGGPVVASQEITDETTAEVEEFLSHLDSGGFLNLEDEQPQSPPGATD